MESLARMLWQGRIIDPNSPDLVQAGHIDGETDYSTCLQSVKALSSHGILSVETLKRALETWAWSIDLALLWVNETKGSDAALDELSTRVHAQNRRYGTLAFARWFRGDVEGAFAAFEALEPSCESYEDDCAALAELSILCDKPVGPVSGPHQMRLSLLSTWRAEGALALARRFDTEIAEFPARPGFWAWLIETFVTENDYKRANEALTRFSVLCAEEHSEVIAQTIRLALDQEDPVAARRLIAHQIEGKAPWTWPPRLHAQNLRCCLIEAAQSSTLDYTDLRNHADAAHRLYPNNALIRGLWLGVCELSSSWDALAVDLLSDNYEAGAASWILGRLGLPDAALARLHSAEPAPPDTLVRRRLRVAELHLRTGELAKAEAALGPLPAARALQADHAYWQSEIALAKRDFETASQSLDAALRHSPTRMGLILNAARAAFLAGQDDEALGHLARFRTLKTSHLGDAPDDDLRDMIVQDALSARKDQTPLSQSPGLSAIAMALSPPKFEPLNKSADIPRIIAHYWEGPRSAPVERGQRQWARLHPDFQQTCYGPSEASAWLRTNAPWLSALFDHQTQPAVRADLFRVALIAEQGGVFADLDEYPRTAITPWLREASAVLIIEEGHGTIANNFLAALPGLPLFTRLQSRISTRLMQTDTPYPWWDCGPAQITLEALESSQSPDESKGLRFLSQAAYDARVSTNLPFPHKRGRAHWR